MISLHNLAEFDWQTHLKQAVTRLDTLLVAVELTANDVDISEEAARSFALKVPLTYLARIKKAIQTILYSCKYYPKKRRWSLSLDIPTTR